MGQTSGLRRVSRPANNVCYHKSVTAPSLPLHLGSDAEFTALREALAQAGFTESAVCWRLNLKRIADFPMDASVPEGPVPKDQLGALIWLLMYGLPIAPNPALPELAFTGRSKLRSGAWPEASGAQRTLRLHSSQPRLASDTARDETESRRVLGSKFVCTSCG